MMIDSQLLSIRVETHGGVFIDRAKRAMRRNTPTFSLSRIIDLRFPLQPHRDITSRYIEHLAFHSSLLISLRHLIQFLFERFGESTFWTWEWKGKWLVVSWMRCFVLLITWLRNLLILSRSKYARFVPVFNYTYSILSLASTSNHISLHFKTFMASCPT